MDMRSVSSGDRDFFLGEQVVVLFNVLDAAFTFFYLTAGLATEANPLLAAAWEAHPSLFLALKAILVGGGLFILHQCRHVPAARAAISAAIVTYGAVVMWHLVHLR